MVRCIFEFSRFINKDMFAVLLCGLCLTIERHKEYIKRLSSFSFEYILAGENRPVMDDESEMKLA
jgi:hypothetical protein